MCMFGGGGGGMGEKWGKPVFVRGGKSDNGFYGGMKGGDGRVSKEG